MLRGGQSQITRSRLITVILLLVIVVLGLVAWASWRKYSQLKRSPNIAAQETTKRITQEVSRLYQLPQNEQPTVAQVQDKAKLKGQTFFNQAQNGDYILIYNDAKLAILYRQKENKLINVGPISINTEGEVAGEQSTKPLVALLNGSGSNDRLEAVKTALQSLDTIRLGSTAADAKNKKTPKTIVVDASGNNGQIANDIAQKLGGSVGGMPPGETAPNDAAIVVIVGVP